MVVLQVYMSSFGFKRFELNKNHNIYPSFLFYGVTLSEMRDKWPMPKHKIPFQIWLFVSIYMKTGQKRRYFPNEFCKGNSDMPYFCIKTFTSKSDF